MNVKFYFQLIGAKAVKMSNSVDNYVNVSSTDSVESCGDASVRASWSSSFSGAEGTPISFSMCFFPSLQPPDDNSLKLPAWASQYFKVNMPFRTSLIDRVGCETPITLLQIEGRIFIGEGWATFNEGHGILPRDFLVFNLFEDLSMEVQICCPCGGEVLDFPSRGCHSHYFHCRDVGFEISHRRCSGPSILLHADGCSSFAALQFSSSNPHFTRCMNDEDMSRPLILRFPNRVADFLPQDRMKYVLSVGGRTWDVIFINSKHGGLFCGGWKDFVVDNDVKIMDTLVFELLQDDQIKPLFTDIQNMSEHGCSSDDPVLNISSNGSDGMHVENSSVSSHYWNALDSFYVLFNSTPGNLDRLALVLPSKVVPFFKTNMPVHTIIVDRHESITNVKLSLVDGKIVIIDGWHEFVVSHNLQPRDLLCFSVFNDHCMFVKIYCPCRTEVFEFPSRGGHNGCVQTMSYDNHIPPVEHSAPSLVPQARYRGPSSSSSSELSSMLFTDSNIPKDALRFTSTYPCFARCLKSISDLTDDLRLPSCLCSVLPSGCTMVTLEVIGGHSSSVICYNNEYGALFSIGWRYFVETNKLKLMDSCVFEIKGDRSINVHIFRF
ncbi:hypothetical protein COLO4_21442 [Corchorus olitorius]|uniref:TF-B3 domain-containing protein n=1 Tax=Corchorus olitorius TaxID=93759 RepID=A0A1R3ITA3_9ROSI|nr:hypothetical protein COLO4_21442 [Corchorus olitorius]